MRLLFTYLACVFLGGMSVNVFAQDKVIFEDDFNHSKKFEKNWFDNSTEEKTGKIEYKKKGGIDNSGCVKISNPERGAIRIRPKVIRAVRPEASPPCSPDTGIVSALRSHEHKAAATTDKIHNVFLKIFITTYTFAIHS